MLNEWGTILVHTVNSWKASISGMWKRHTYFHLEYGKSRKAFMGRWHLGWRWVVVSQLAEIYMMGHLAKAPCEQRHRGELMALPLGAYIQGQWSDAELELLACWDTCILFSAAGVPAEHHFLSSAYPSCSTGCRGAFESSPCSPHFPHILRVILKAILGPPGILI